MGMDVFGTNGNYFRANIWSWSAILLAIKMAGHSVPDEWHTNDGYGLNDAVECHELARKLERFLELWPYDRIELETEHIAVDACGSFVSPGTPGSMSPYSVDRDHLREFIAFLKECDGFEIH